MVLRVIFVLALAFASVQASPLRSGFLGRLWRRSADLAQTTPSPTQGEVSVSDAAIASQYALLATRARTICRRINILYSNYSAQRFPQGSQQNPWSDYSFGNLASGSSSTRVPDRTLITRHYNNLFVLEDTLRQVGESETTNVTRRLEIITAKIRVLINGLKNLMPSAVNIEPTGSPFGNATLTDQERNQRTLHILDAAAKYMFDVKEDYKELSKRQR